MWEVILLLVLLAFFLYMWNTRTAESKPTCNTCPGKKNVDGI